MIESPSLLVVGVDTGIKGAIDREQTAWLRRVSLDPRPKILVTGKPIYTRNEYKPSKLEGGGTIDDIVRDPRHRYVAAIGGDVHNYQRYPVKVGDRVIHYIVSGGGGAFMHATHTIRRVDVGGVHEDDFRCYPLRGTRCRSTVSLYAKRLRMKWIGLTPDEAACIMAEQIKNTPVRPIDRPVKVTARMRWAAPAARLLAVAVPAAGGYGVPALPVRAVGLGHPAVLQAVPAPVGHSRPAHRALLGRHRLPAAGGGAAHRGRGADRFDGFVVVT